jgi:hypothetical protein
MDQLILLLSRADPEFEKQVIGGLDWRITSSAVAEIERRISGKGIESLSPQQQERLLQAVRGRLRLRSSWGSGTLLDFAATYDPKSAAELFLENPDLIRQHPERAFRACARAGREVEAWRLIEPRLNSLDESQVCEALRIIAETKVRVANIDKVYALTKSLRWLVRLHALCALDQLDDPRACDALRSHLSDIKRSSIGLRVFSGFGALQAMMAQEFLRTELIKALVRRNVPGAAETLESIVLDSWQGESVARMTAGVGLAMLDRQRGVAVVKRLLRSSNEADQFTGVGIASHGLAEDVKDDLRRVAEKSRHRMARDEAAQALRELEEWKDLPPEERKLQF